MAVLEEIIKEKTGIGEDVELSPQDILDYLKGIWDKYKTWIMVGVGAIIVLAIASKFLGKRAPEEVVYRYH